jgi:hypothetical protein
MIGLKYVLIFLGVQVIKTHIYGGGKMKHLSNRYEKVTEYKGMDICTLRVATPSDGDELGYRIDDISYDGRVFDDLGEAMKAIDSFGMHLEEKSHE